MIENVSDQEAIGPALLARIKQNTSKLFGYQHSLDEIEYCFQHLYLEPRPQAILRKEFVGEAPEYNVLDKFAAVTEALREELIRDYGLVPSYFDVDIHPSIDDITTIEYRYLFPKGSPIHGLLLREVLLDAWEYYFPDEPAFIQHLGEEYTCLKQALANAKPLTEYVLFKR